MRKNISCWLLLMRHTPGRQRVTYYSGSHATCRVCGRDCDKRTSRLPIG